MYKKALHSFFLKVHPDFFTSAPTQQRVNEASIAQLNELLGWAKEFKGGILRPPPATEISFSFFSQGEASKTSVDGTTKIIPPVSLEVHATFQLPNNFVANDANKGLVERSTNKFLRDLLRKAKCIDGVADSIAVAEDAALEKEEVKPLRRRSVDLKKRSKPAKSLLDDAAEAMVETWNLTSLPTMDELMEADQVLFSQTLSPVQSAHALDTLRQTLGELMYERWQNMPLLISDHFSVGDISGTLTIPWDFTLPRFYAFLQQNDAAIQKERKQVESFAHRVETLISEICRDLEVDDVLISCSHKSALNCLELLHRNRLTLAQHGVQRVSLEIGTKFSLRANGVVIVPHDMDYTKMTAWLRVVKPKLALQQKLYALSKQMLESTMWHLKEFRSIVQPAGIDAFDNDCTYVERQKWAKELFSVAGSLAQWDWSEFTFSIGPLDINWDDHTMTLPPDVDGAGIVRYIESVHASAKERKRDQQLKDSAMAKEKEEHMTLEQRNPSSAFEEHLSQEFPELNGGKRDDEQHSADAATTQQASLNAHADALAKYGGGSRSRQQQPTQPQQWGGGDIAADPKARKAAELRASAPYMEEYMTSSPTSVDELSVERPLAHAVTFASDDEAKDQMIWEGFYDDNFVDQIPASTQDDVRRAFLATNRNHREAAAKQMVEELQKTYGKKKKNFSHIKMGDLTGINDPKKQPRGFPILSPGVKGSRAATN